MSLPFDISTSLWFVSVPDWEWELDPPPCPDTEAAAEAAAPAAGADLVGLPISFELDDPTPPAPGPGYHLVLKGYDIDTAAVWCYADSAVSRPWTRRENLDDPDKHHRRIELPAAPVVDAPAPDTDRSGDR